MESVTWALLSIRDVILDLFHYKIQPCDIFNSIVLEKRREVVTKEITLNFSTQLTGVIITSVFITGILQIKLQEFVYIKVTYIIYYKSYLNWINCLKYFSFQLIPVYIFQF